MEKLTIVLVVSDWGTKECNLRRRATAVDGTPGGEEETGSEKAQGTDRRGAALFSTKPGRRWALPSQHGLTTASGLRVLSLDNAVYPLGCRRRLTDLVFRSLDTGNRVCKGQTRKMPGMTQGTIHKAPQLRMAKLQRYDDGTDRTYSTRQLSNTLSLPPTPYLDCVETFALPVTAVRGTGTKASPPTNHRGDTIILPWTPRPPALITGALSQHAGTSPNTVEEDPTG